jgi:outer membrane protein assembly factor BamA
MARYYALVYRREGYRSFETGLEGQTTWKFGDHYTLDLLGGYSLVNLSEDGLPVSELGETVYTQPRLRLTQTLDYRDSAVLPTRGWHLESPLEIGAAVGNLSTSYAKASLKGGWYHKLNSDYQLGLGGDVGVLIPSGDGQDLPIDLRLFNGGSRSVRSFPERQLGPTVNDYATGGEATWNSNAELIRSLGGTLKAVAFFDAGTLSRSYDQLGSSDIELAIGLGLRLNLPIGPIRLEYGYNLTQDSGEPTGTLHFAIGITF